MTFLRAPRAVVVDASVAVDLVAGDERWMGRWREWLEGAAQLLVPPGFDHEVANALLRGQRRSAADTAIRLERLFEAGLEIADRGLPGLLESVALAERTGLTVCDAAYLQLALDTEAELATRDEALAAAGREAGLVVHA